jgi:RNA-directed DNA polymerase
MGTNATATVPTTQRQLHSLGEPHRCVARLGLEVNKAKTLIAGLPEQSFDFLGYTVGGFHGKDRRIYIGTRPSTKAVRSPLKRMHERPAPQW